MTVTKIPAVIININSLFSFILVPLVVIKKVNTMMEILNNDINNFN